VLDILVQSRRNAGAAKRFFRRLLKGLQYAPRVLITDKLGSYGVAKRELLPDVELQKSRYLNNRAENSHRPTRRRERQMHRFKSTPQAQRFLSAHAFIYGHFRPRRHLTPPGTVGSRVPWPSRSGPKRPAPKTQHFEHRRSFQVSCIMECMGFATYVGSAVPKGLCGDAKVLAGALDQLVQFIAGLIGLSHGTRSLAGNLRQLLRGRTASKAVPALPGRSRQAGSNGARLRKLGDVPDFPLG
jgi:hypothetical protein